MVCWVMVTRNGSCLRLSVAFICWVKNLSGSLMPAACLPGLGARGCQQGVAPNPGAKGTEGEFPGHGLELQGYNPCRPAKQMEETCHHPYLGEMSPSGPQSWQLCARLQWLWPVPAHQHAVRPLHVSPAATTDS